MFSDVVCINVLKGEDEVLFLDYRKELKVLIDNIAMLVGVIMYLYNFICTCIVHMYSMYLAFCC